MRLFPVAIPFLAILGLSGCATISAPGVTVASVTDLGAIPTDPDILGRDGGYSALFQGQSVWLYGDTFLAQPNAQNFTLISDSWSFTSDLDAQSGLAGFQQPLDTAGAPTMILPETSAEQAFNAAHNPANCRQQPCGARYALWQASIAVDPSANQAFLFYSLVYSLPGSFNFQALGNSVATWASLMQQPQRPILDPVVVAGHPDLLFGPSEPNFGSASLVVDGMLYVFGCGTPSSGTDKGCRLARVAPSDVLNRPAWTFYAANGTWTMDDSAAISVFTGDNILSVSWNAYTQRFLALYSAVFSQHVMLRTAPTLEGPWSGEVLAFTAMQPASGNVYDAIQHPEFDANGGQTIFVSYSRTTPSPNSSEIRLVSLQTRQNTGPVEAV